MKAFLVALMLAHTSAALSISPPHCCLPKQVVAILWLFGLPQLNIWWSFPLTIWVAQNIFFLYCLKLMVIHGDMAAVMSYELSWVLKWRVLSHTLKKYLVATRTRTRRDWWMQALNRSLTGPGKAFRKLGLKVFLQRSFCPLALGSPLVKPEKISLY